MSFYGASDLDAMLAEFGVPVVLGSQTVDGILDISDVGDAGELITKQASVLVKTGALKNLKEGASLDVDGKSYLVTGTDQLGDGATTQVFLGPV